MTGEHDLQTLLTNMSPDLIEGEFVFCCFKDKAYGDHEALQPIGAFIEDEGLTLIAPRGKADEQGVVYDSVFRCITLRVHSSLDAVGLTAALSAKLMEHGISANVVAGYHHDHIFVQRDCAQRALDALGELGR